MKKAKRTFINTPKANGMVKATSMVNNWDFTYQGFIVDHKERTIFVLENTDAEIRMGNEDLLNKFFEIVEKHPTYDCSVLHMMFAS